METEVWPNLIRACNRLDIPVVLANARLSEKSLKRGRQAGAVMLEAARGFAALVGFGGVLLMVRSDLYESVTARAVRAAARTCCWSTN